MDARLHVTRQQLPIQVTKNVYVPLARKREVITHCHCYCRPNYYCTSNKVMHDGSSLFSAAQKLK